MSEFEICYSKVECHYSQCCHPWWPIWCIQFGCGCLYRYFEITVNSLVCELLEEGYCCSWIYKSLIVFSCMYHYCWTICDECHCNLVYNGSPPCSWESQLADASLSLKDLIPLPIHWSKHWSIGYGLLLILLEYESDLSGSYLKDL